MTLAIENLQPKLVRVFANIIDHQQLSQAYVFAGPSGTGKYALAEWIAMRLFCQNLQDGHPCGQCPECQRILSHNHPDVVTVETATRSLKVDDIRALKDEMSKSGVEGNTRVFIIKDADKLTAGAANSLLKFYEEPMAGMTVILTTTAKNQLLPTILSRAQVVNFQAPGRKQLVAQLKQAGISTQLALVAAQLSADETQAEALAADENFQARIDKVEQVTQQIAAHDPTAMVQVQTQLVPLAKTPADQAQILSLFALIYEDALNQHYQLKTEGAFSHTDVVKQLAAQSDKAISAALQTILTAQVQLTQNVTFQSDTEQMILKLLEG